MENNSESYNVSKVPKNTEERYRDMIHQYSITCLRKSLLPASATSLIKIPTKYYFEDIQLESFLLQLDYKLKFPFSGGHDNTNRISETAMS
jgi:hypothetical protein